MKLILDDGVLQLSDELKMFLLLLLLLLFLLLLLHPNLDECKQNEAAEAENQMEL